jgi:lipopolysaccharide export system permease protein
MVVGLRQKYLWELAFPAPDDAVYKASPAQFRVELHERLYAPLYPLAFGFIAFAILGFPRTTRQSRAVSMFAVIVGVAGLRLAGFAGTAMAASLPAAIIAVYLMIAASTAFGAFVVWRGIPLDLDEKLNFAGAVRTGAAAVERFAARFNLRFPARDMLRRFGTSDP